MPWQSCRDAGGSNGHAKVAHQRLCWIEAADARYSRNAFSEEEMIALLQRLVCKHLEIHEIINASLKEHSAGYGPELKPNIDRSGKLTISVGTNPHYVATILNLTRAIKPAERPAAQLSWSFDRRRAAEAK